jgi:hypothetical protein
MWLSWQVGLQVAIALFAACTVARLAFGRRDRKAIDGTTTLGFETARVFTLYAIWQYTKDMTSTKVAGAREHGISVFHFEQRLHFPSELALEQAFLHHRWALQFLNIYYGGVHVPMLGIILVWMYFRHRDGYGLIRNVTALTTAGCIVIQMIPVAPPRLLPELGFVDEAIVLHQSVYGTGGSGVSNQLAAMPSLHYAWAFIVTVAVLRFSTSRRKWLILLHPALTALAVTATANHWWLDGVVAGLVMVVAIGVQLASASAFALARARWTAWRGEAAAGDELVPELALTTASEPST